MKEQVFVLIFLLKVLLVASQAPAPSLLNGTFVLDSSSLKYGKEGEAFPFVNDQTIPEVWSNQLQYISSDGSSNQGGLYSFGPTGSPTRGLGTICSNSKRTIIFGMSFVANETISVLNITVGYEQFRYGGFNETAVLTMDYNVGTMQEYPGMWGGNGSTVGWISQPALFFQSLVNTTSNVPPGPLTGYTKTATGVIQVSVPQGMVLQLRWMVRGLRDGVGVTKMEITTTPSPTPSPSPFPSPSPTPAPAPTTDPSPGPSPSPNPGPSPSPTPAPSPVHGPKFARWKLWTIAAGGTVVTLGVVGSLIYAMRKRNARHRYESVETSPENPENPMEPPYPPIAQGYQW